MAFKKDMTMMYAVHDALRRELDRIARVTARTDDDPKHVLRTAAGWGMFKSYLHVHHTTEDELFWPPLRKSPPEDSHATALLDAMEAEHGAIDPFLAAIDAALADVQCPRLLRVGTRPVLVVVPPLTIGYRGGSSGASVAAAPKAARKPLCEGPRGAARPR
jgi:hypothetical protein